MQSKSSNLVSPRTERYRNRQIKKDLANDVTITTEVPVKLSPQFTPRAKRRDAPLSQVAPSQQRNVKKRREDKKMPPSLPQDQTEVHSDVKSIPTAELVSVEDKTQQIEEWVRQFEQFSNSKQSIALSMLVPRYYS